MPSDDVYSNIQEFATGGGGEGDPALSTSGIRDYVENELSQLGVFHTDESTLPETAEARSGEFYSYDDLVDWWEGSGLLFWDENGNLIPNPMVHVVAWDDPETDEVYYTVYVDEDAY